MTVSRDSTSGWYVPNSASEWTELLAGTGLSNPSNLWLCQEASGNLADSIGAVTLVGEQTPLYQQTVSGWTRKAVGFTDGTLQHRFQTTSIGDTSTTSYLLFMYVAITATPASTRSLMGIGSGAGHRYTGVNTTPRYTAQILFGGSTAGTTAHGTTVHPVIMMINRASSKFKIYTDLETIEQTWSAPVTSGNIFCIGDAINAGSPTARILYIANFTGSAAERSDADISTLLGKLQNGPVSITAARNRLVNEGRMGPQIKGSVT